MALTAEQNERLTRVEGNAPMGRLMRDHCWIPAILSVQLAADGAPRRVRLLGTDYVAFRDSAGNIGFLDEGCPHRNTSLVLARNEECGLRCIFHGWKMDVSGQVLEAPTHDPDPEAFAAKIRTRSFPTVEGGGVVWVWLGDTEAPPFPHLTFTVLPETHVWFAATPVACNWLQAVEATIDSAHVGTLHRAYIEAHAQKNTGATVGKALEALAPQYDVARTEWGIDAIASRPMPRRHHLRAHDQVGHALRGDGAGLTGHSGRRRRRDLHRLARRRHPPQPVLRVLVAPRPDQRRPLPERARGHGDRGG